MTLDHRFEQFYDRWLEKAQEYGPHDLNGYFDKFITLYIVCNALYAKAAVHLHRKALREGKDAYKWDERDRFPDKQAATKYVLDVLGSRSLLESLENTEDTRRAIAELDMLMEQDRFYICLEPMTGQPLLQEDEKIRIMLKSSSSDEKARAFLRIIYEVRCNLFHGRKGFRTEQRDLLIPLTEILDKVINLLHRRLKETDSRV